MTYDPDWKADPELISRLQHSSSGQELLRSLQWEIDKLVLLLRDHNLTDPHSAGNVGYLQGQLKVLHNLNELILGPHLKKEEVNDGAA